ncbi:oligopeptide ABC transporter, ATP binding protein [Aeropyrum pernix K1]|uniref:Oligopeptide ABC transporter, ATP binding protein n=1 Tax=Aeropyrum pernix (strain ATCC 700893 / DSM 11879 / JCM 9820 / NBRC 100138 / K1) TaxID=272557 RepID=Q9YBM0_AERPE|nr:oligopeptide/dipeptide ABC transporter ATP-binding protein [Aeropyrum pernix]BAA80578.1 oligopeptide ABC transporter, ATP binding protein [Aeropyrum pernix K1]
MAQELLVVEDLKTYFYTLRGIVKAVDGVSFTLRRGEVLGIAGESGSGKSTLAWSILGLVPPPGRIVGGRIMIDGMDVTSMSEAELRRKVRWKKVSMVFQGAMNVLTPVYTVGRQIEEVLQIHRGVGRHEARQRVYELLESVGLHRSIADRYPHELSGGQKQRVVIAMALALEPDIVIADEPTTALDVVVQAQILNLLKKLAWEKNLSIILITHDLSVIAELAETVMIMYGGKIAEYGPSDAVFTKPQHPYTQALLKAIPKLRGPIDRLAYIPGSPPDLRNPPPGCRFHPRCPKAFDRCSREEPPLFRVGDGHLSACWLNEGGGE